MNPSPIVVRPVAETDLDALVAQTLRTFGDRARRPGIDERIRNRFELDRFVVADDGGRVVGGGQWLVAEADESDGSFLRLNPVVAVITNIDADHLENYGGDFERVKQAFAEFLHRLPFYGLAVLCIDDEEVAQLARRTPRHVVTYGFAPEADVRAADVRQHGARMQFTLCLPDGSRTACIKPGHPTLRLFQRRIDPMLGAA